MRDSGRVDSGDDTAFEDTDVIDSGLDSVTDTGTDADVPEDGRDADDPTYVDIYAADNHVCAVRSSVEVVCWGASDHGEAMV